MPPQSTSASSPVATATESIPSRTSRCPAASADHAPPRYPQRPPRPASGLLVTGLTTLPITLTETTGAQAVPARRVPPDAYVLKTLKLEPKSIFKESRAIDSPDTSTR